MHLGVHSRAGGPPGLGGTRTITKSWADAEGKNGMPERYLEGQPDTVSVKYLSLIHI